MRSTIQIITFLAWLFGLAAILASCESELPLPVTNGSEKIVLLGELTAGDTVTLRAGRSTLLNAGTSNQQLIDNLSLELKEGTGAITVLNGVRDDLSATLFTLKYSSPLPIQSGSAYQLLGKHPDLGQAGLEVRIPGAFTATASGTFTTYNGDSVLSFEITLNDPAAANAQYVIEVVKQPAYIFGYFLYNGNEYSITDSRALYDSLKQHHVPVTERYDTSYTGTYSRQQMYTTDLNSSNLAGTPSGRLFRRVFLSGKSFGGSSHRTQILLPVASLHGQYGQNAQTVIYVKSVSPDYFEALKAYDQYDPSLGLSGNIAPLKVEGNVTGGFGIVGGVYRMKWEMVY